MPPMKEGIAHDASDTGEEFRKQLPRMPYLVPEKDAIFNYSVVRNLFVQSLPDYLIDETEFNENYKDKNFGLMLYDEKEQPDWKAFVARVNELNANAAPDETYKVFYLARHGEGPHNVAIKTYSHPVWDREIAMSKEYKGLILGPDPDLTDDGKAEAKIINSIWKTQVEKYGLHEAGAMPQRFYASPFTRALRTLEITWADIVLNLPDAPRVTVREKFRETIGRHWCDHRGVMSEVKQKFPFIDVEDGMADEDTVWTETREDEDNTMPDRLRESMDDIFLESGETFISITAHSGCIRAILRVVGHRLFSLDTSRMIPVLVKARLKPEYKSTYSLPSRVSGLPYKFPASK